MKSLEERKEAKREANRRWRKNNVEANREYNRKWREQNPEYAREYNLQHPKKRVYKKRPYKELSTEEQKIARRTRDREYFRTHPEQRLKKNARKRKYYKDNPKKRRVWSKDKRLKKFGSIGRFTKKQWLQLKESYGNCCLCCGRSEVELSLAHLKLVPDHVIPLSKGGRNDIFNIQPLCHSGGLGSTGGCNLFKGVAQTDYRVVMTAMYMWPAPCSN